MGYACYHCTIINKLPNKKAKKDIQEWLTETTPELSLHIASYKTSIQP
jgi:hypothetical protein